MPRLQDLYDKRASVWGSYQEILARSQEAAELSAEDRQALDRAEADLRQIAEDIGRLEAADRRVAEAGDIDRGRNGNGGGDDDTRTGDPTGGNGDEGRSYDDAFSQFLRFGAAEMDAELRQVLTGRQVDTNELRAQGVATGGAGGYTVPPAFRNKLVERLVAFGGMRQAAQTITTETGAEMPWPTNDDTGNEGAYIAENTQVTEQDTTFGQSKLQAHLITSKIIRVPYTLLQDSAFNLDTWLPGKLAERIARRENRAFTVGTGTDEPTGIVTGATTGHTAAAGQVDSVTYDDMVDTEHSVNRAYRQRGRWMFNDNTLAVLRKLKDGDSRPLWQPSLQAGAPDLYNGKPYIVNDDMPDLGASKKPILFGDFELAYLIRDVRDIAVLRLTERYADFLQVGFLAFARHDGGIDDPYAVRAFANPAE